MTTVLVLIGLVVGGPVLLYFVLVAWYAAHGYPLTPAQRQYNIRWNTEHGFMEAGAMTAHRAARDRGAAYATGAVSSFASGSYAGARMARNLHAVTTGRVLTRAANITVGRTLVSRMWFR